jgi:hypothetical protein
MQDRIRDGVLSRVVINFAAQCHVELRNLGPGHNDTRGHGLA